MDKKLYNETVGKFVIGLARKEDCMTEHETPTDLSEERRKEIFRALVEAQDEGLAVPQSRLAISERFGLTETQVRHIEREGIENEWPPL